MELYGCSVCGACFLSEEELYEHLEKVHGIKGDDLEAHMLYLSGLTEDQAKEILRSQEREIESLQGLPQKELEESYPYYYPYGSYGYSELYPQYPYYPKRKPIIYKKGDYYICGICGKKYKRPSTMIDHFRVNHPKFYPLVLKYFAIEKYKKILKMQGRVKDLEQVDKLAEKEVLGRIIREYFSTPEQQLRLGELVTDKVSKIYEFLKDEKKQLCPLCHSTNPTVEQETLSKFDLKGKPPEKYVSKITFNGNTFKTCFRKLLHLATHRATFITLHENRILDGPQVKQIYSLIKPKKKAREELMRRWMESKDRTPPLEIDKRTQIWLWLKKRDTCLIDS